MMSLNKYILIFLPFLFNTTNSCSQIKDKWTLAPIDSAAISLFDYEQNKLENPQALTPLFTKLHNLKNGSQENVVLVHIGDSHIQADLLSDVVRSEFQKYFGNAGRGLVFPYQVVKTNGPFEYHSSSNSTWKWNRIARNDTIPSCGISGFGMHSKSENPEFSIKFKNYNKKLETFDKITLFTNEDLRGLNIEYNDCQLENGIYDASKAYVTINLKSPASSFNVSFPGKDTIRFYGASLEKLNTPGVIYHSIGVNGAQCSDYNKTSLFWKQLKQLKADCYIVSLGTNEAQLQGMAPEEFLVDLTKMVENIRKVSPTASIVLSTPPVSYYNKIAPNAKLCDVVDVITDYCIQNNITYWDLFNISKGLEGATTWGKKKYLRSDLIHFSREGYRVQGALLAEAFAASWNTFLTTK
jgi:lysophospholipase L1-like esterase